MKLSDYIAQRIAKMSVHTVFGYQGSSISHIIDSICRNEKLSFVQTRHEQAAAFAANGYALTTEGIGVAISCSGPGVTNLITGIANAYYDSIPCLFITGQVSVKEMKKDSAMRQFGFQETDIVSMVSPITKYAVTVKDPQQIRAELDHAIYEMTQGRPGPVLLDIPHNVQGSEIDLEQLPAFFHEEKQKRIIEQEVVKAANLLKEAKRPLILLGGGAQGLRAQPYLLEFLCQTNIPMIASYRGKDILDNCAQSYCGVIGCYGDRCANWAAKYCDVLLVIGSRLDGRQNGDGLERFACDAQVIVLDVDAIELKNMPERFHKIEGQAVHFCETLTTQTQLIGHDEAWLKTVMTWRNRYPDAKEFLDTMLVNPNAFLNKLSHFMHKDALITLDVGQNQLWGNTSLQVRQEQRLLQSCGLGSMGFAIPAAIGGYFANKQQTICICGDGGFQMNSQELQTAACCDIPLKIFVMNNQSLGLIRVYQKKALGERYFGSVEGFDSPDFSLLAQAYHFSYAKIEQTDCDTILKDVLTDENPWLVEVVISDESTCYPEPTYLSSIDNQSPLISEHEKTQIIEEAYHAK